MDLTSKKTARKQIPAIYRKVLKRNGWNQSANLDIGGGPYDDFSDLLKKQHKITNYIYDPYNRTAEENLQTILFLAKTENPHPKTATISNVLNVVRSKKDRQNILRFAQESVCGTVYITVYEGDNSSRWKSTKCGMQANRPLSSYLKEVRKVFPLASIENGMIIAESKNPLLV
jgi:hypothetical protein